MSRGETGRFLLASSNGRNLQLSIATIRGSEFIKNKMTANN